MSANITKSNGKRKAHRIKDLTELSNLFDQEAAPLVDLLSSKLDRLESINENALPYVLDEIAVLSESITNLEALFGLLCGYYCELAETCFFLESQWRGASERMKMFSELYLAEKAKSGRLMEQFSKLQKTPL